MEENNFPVPHTSLRMMQFEDLDPEEDSLLTRMRLIEVQGLEDAIATERMNLLDLQLNQCFYKAGVNFREECKELRFLPFLLFLLFDSLFDSLSGRST